jgi:hypothetical protein
MPRSPFMRAGFVRVIAAMKGAQDATDTEPAPAQNRAAGQLALDRAVPARQGDQIAAAISGHQPGGSGKRRQMRSSSGMAQIGHVLSIPRHFGRETGHARPRDGDSQSSPNVSL